MNLYIRACGFNYVTCNVSTRRVRKQGVGCLTRQLFVRVQGLGKQGGHLTTILVIVRPYSTVGTIQLLHQVLSTTRQTGGRLIAIVIYVLASVQNLLFHV